MDSKEILAKFCPIFEFHSKEIFFPSSADDYLSKCRLLFRDEVILEYGEVTNSNLKVQTAKVGTIEVCSGKHSKYDKDWVLYFPDEYIAGCNPEFINKVPVYGKIDDKFSENTTFDIHYVTMYPYNGYYRLWGLPFLRAGQHKADIEHVTVRVNREHMKVVEIFFAAHRSRDGTWKERDEIRFLKGTERPIAYVAKAGHGHYWKPGRYIRMYCAANDLVGGGVRWDPSEVIELFDREDSRSKETGTEWLDFVGQWSDHGNESPALKNWYNNEWPFGSRNRFKRMFWFF